MDIYHPVQICTWQWIFTIQSKFACDGGYLLSSPNLPVMVDIYRPVQICAWGRIFTVQAKFVRNGGYLPSNPDFVHDGGYLPSSPNLHVMVDIYSPIQICMWWWIFTIQSKFARDSGYLLSSPNCAWWWTFTVQSKFVRDGGCPLYLFSGQWIFPL